MKFSMIVAMDKQNGIGINNDLPWNLPTDMKYFRDKTASSGWSESPKKIKAVIMGRNTFESLPINVRPLPKRLNIVLSRDTNYNVPDGVITALSLDEAFEKVEKYLKNEDVILEEVFIIGGANVYAQAIEHKDCEKLYITEIDKEYNCDAFFPSFSKSVFVESSRSEKINENGTTYEFVIYQKA